MKMNFAESMIILKWLGIVDCSWRTVLLPTFIGLVVFGGLCVVAFIKTRKNKKKGK